MRQIVAQARPVEGGRGALVRGDAPVFRALRGRLRDGIRERERQLSRKRRVERRGIDRARRSNAAAELQPGDAQLGGLLQLRNLRARQLQAEVERIGLDGGPRRHLGTRDPKLLARAPQPITRDAIQLGVGQDVVIVELGEERGREALDQLAGVRALERSARARQLSELLAAEEQIVRGRDRPLHRVLFRAQGPEIEERRIIARGRRRQTDGRQDEHGECAAPRPHRVVYLADRRDVVRVELHGALQRFAQRDLWQRVDRRGRDGGLQRE